MMKIAVPTRNHRVDEHFGQCENYTVIAVNKDKEVIKYQLIPVENGCGCKSGIADTLRKENVSVLLAGNMGGGAVEKFRIAGIEVVRGCSGPIDRHISDYLHGSITDNGANCARHEHHHGHDH